MITTHYTANTTYPELCDLDNVERRERLILELIQWLLDEGWEVFREAYYKQFFTTERKWRADIIARKQDVDRIAVIEIQGGSWNSGRHTRGKGYADDLRKSNCVNFEGQTFLAFTYEMLEDREYEKYLI